MTRILSVAIATAFITGCRTMSVVVNDQPTLERVKGIVMPEVTFRGANISDLVGFFQLASKEYSNDKQGVNVLVISHDDEIIGPKPRLLGLSLENVSMYDAVRYIAEAMRLRLEFDRNTVVFRDR